VVTPDEERGGVSTRTNTPGELSKKDLPKGDSDVENTPLDFDIMGEAECILKQRNQKGASFWFGGPIKMQRTVGRKKSTFRTTRFFIGGKQIHEEVH